MTELSVIASHRQSLRQALNHSVIKQYTAFCGHAHISTSIDAILSKFASINEQNENLTGDLQDAFDTIDDELTYCDQNQTFLADQFYRKFLKAANQALEGFKSAARGRFLASITPNLPPDGIVEKRQPLHESGRIIRVSIPLRNTGPARALGVTISIAITGESIALDAPSQAVGSVPPGPFAFIFDAMVVEQAEQIDGLMEISWSEFGLAEEKTEIFPFRIVAQNPSIDWEEQEFSRPYSFNVARGDEFIGRKDKVRAFANRMLRTPMESFYVTGQKRVGKTSLILASSAFAKSHPRGAKLFELYLLWGNIAHDESRASVEELGKRIAATIVGSLPPGSIVPTFQFRGSLAPLTGLVEIAEKISPQNKYVIIIDEFDEIHSDLYVSGMLAESLFGNLRALTNYSNLCIVLVGGENMPFIIDRQGQKLNKLASDSLDYYSKISEWDDFCNLVRLPSNGVLEWHDDAIEEVFRVGNGNPYFAKLICASIFSRAIAERDSDITFDEVRAAYDREIIASDTPFFQHLWQDGVHKPIAEREPDVLRRTRALVAIGRVLRRDEKITIDSVWRNRYSVAISEAEVSGVLLEFTRRNILIENAGVFTFRLPVFEDWLREVGVARLAHDVISEEIARSVQAEEDAAFVTSKEITALTENWPTYQGKKVGSEEVRTWIEQVETQRDQRLLFKLLANITFYSEIQVRELLRTAHSVIRKALPPPVYRARGNRRDDLVVLYVDGEGKSGQFYASRFADENSISPKSISSTRGFAALMTSRSKDGKSTHGIALIDDIIASGRSFSRNITNFIESNQELLREIKVPVIAFALTSTAQGDGFVRDSLSKYDWLDWDLRVGSYLDNNSYAFGESSTIWTNGDESDRAKALVSDLGSRIYFDHPLGFDDQALLIVFPETCPNNTIPIIHSGSKLGQKNWRPIFRRLT
ncbi:ATP-binding protein [Methylobacterium sp. R2-1]|uniref:phosphoribosyltransferase-like protein n=1 Tax=Methylobacterium sp. R2-1 TaxID=2587064 RepID=UPI0016133818|nr:ATP-binding protein [Methylobacterium sp. R2-1]MBB2962553.1 hypothetical protein [Methylobacterium sp. R2-1]